MGKGETLYFKWGLICVGLLVLSAISIIALSGITLSYLSGKQQKGTVRAVAGTWIVLALGFMGGGGYAAMKFKEAHDDYLKVTGRAIRGEIGVLPGNNNTPPIMPRQQVQQPRPQYAQTQYRPPMIQQQQQQQYRPPMIQQPQYVQQPQYQPPMPQQPSENDFI